MHAGGPRSAGLLNRVEWLKFLGLFFNREREATQLFNDKAAHFEELRVGGRAGHPWVSLGIAEYPSWVSLASAGKRRG